MNETITAFLEELDPFWHFLAPLIVSGFLGCLFGVFLSCLFCRPKAAPAAPVQEKTVPQTSLAPPAPAPLSPVQAAARPPEVQSGQAHVGNLGLLYQVKPPDADDLTLINGLNSATAVRLRDLGIYQFDQISLWTPAIVDSIRLSIPGAHQAIEENWVPQAKRLASLKAEGKPLTALPREELR